MRKLRYSLVDVFTDRAFGGNPLAVFTNGRGISSDLMQSIAKELNLSETTFVLPAENPNNDYKVRIFTPALELPMAGHPTIGTAFVLGLEHMIESSGSQTTANFEEGVGTIPVTVQFKAHLPVWAEMRQPRPIFGSRFDDVDGIAEMLSLESRSITDTNLPMVAISCGVPFLFVPVKNLQSVQKIRFRREVWERVLRDFEASSVFVFTQEVQVGTSTVHARMFAPGFGVLEDPATGGASGPLGCYLVRYGVVPPARENEYISEQGFEIGRPSFIKIKIKQEAGEITEVRVGGQCYFIGEGYLELRE